MILAQWYSGVAFNWGQEGGSWRFVVVEWTRGSGFYPTTVTLVMGPEIQSFLFFFFFFLLNLNPLPASTCPLSRWTQLMLSILSGPTEFHKHQIIYNSWYKPNSSRTPMQEQRKGKLKNRLPLAQWSRLHLLMQEVRIPSPGWEHPLEKEMATHSNILAWEIPQTVNEKEPKDTENLDEGHTQFFSE